MNKILNIILYTMSPVLIIGGLIALAGVTIAEEPGSMAIPVILVNGLVPITTGCIIIFKLMKEYYTTSEY